MMQATIARFYGRYEFLSNFHACAIAHDGIIYTSVEHAFQAAKTLNFRLRLEGSKIASPGQAKHWGRTLSLRPDWENVKLPIMFELVLQKFARHPDLRHLLLETGEAQLIEGNWWHDHFWGVCHGKGENHLGRILMSVRDLLRA